MSRVSSSATWSSRITDFHSRGARPAQRTRTPSSCISSRRRRITSRLKPIRNFTSSGERDQFSVEKAYAEIAFTPISIAALDHVEERALALLVALGPRQPALLGPAAVAVHDDRDVPRHEVLRDRRRGRAGGVRRRLADGAFHGGEPRTPVRTAFHRPALLAVEPRCGMLVRCALPPTRRSPGWLPGTGSPSTRTRPRAGPRPPPPPDAVRFVRLVPDGTDGESLTVVLTADGRTAVHVRRTRVLELGPDAPGLDERLAALVDVLRLAPPLTRWLRCEGAPAPEPRNPVREVPRLAGSRGSSPTLLAPRPPG